MYFNDKPKDCGLEPLAVEVTRGVAGAAARLREQLEPALAVIARRVLRTGGGQTELHRQIREEAGRLTTAPGAWPAADPDDLARRVARRICETVVSNLRARPAGRPLAETVLL